jgi:GWxTD domain-containing protein
MNRWFVAASALLFLMPLCSSAQDNAPQGMGPRTGPGMMEGSGFFLIEAVSMPAEDTTQSRVDVMYRIDRSFFVPVKNNDPATHLPYLRRGELLIEVVDSTGTSQARNIDRLAIGDDKTDRSPLDPEWYQGVISFQVQPGRYHIRVELSDLESRRTFLNERIPLHARPFGPSHFALSDPLFVTTGTQGTFSDTLRASNVGGELLFSSPQDLLFVVSGIDTTKELMVEHSLSVMERTSEDSTLVEHVAPTTRAVRTHKSLSASADRGEVVYTLQRSTGSTTGIVVLPLGTQLLPLRSFMLRVKVTQGAKEATIVKPFRAVWPQMPLSLKDIDKALDLLRYITTGSLLDSLRRGSFEERRNHLEAFWKAKDKTPSTAYNEVMTEYYRRADHATREFATLRQPEGWKTDRGKAYMFYGPPSSVRRSLDPEKGFQEIWTYERTSKMLTFVDQNRSGDYILLASKLQ